MTAGSGYENKAYDGDNPVKVWKTKSNNLTIIQILKPYTSSSDETATFA